MLESELKILLRQVLLDGLTARGFPDVQVKSAYQPRQQGVPTPASLFIHEVGEHRRGSPKRTYTYNETTFVYDYTETELIETRYQIAGLSPQSPATPTAPTTADLLRMATNILQHNDALATFKSNNVGILRIMDINTLYFENDRGQNDANPTFECVLSHSDIYTVPGVAVTRVRENIVSI